MREAVVAQGFINTEYCVLERRPAQACTGVLLCGWLSRLGPAERWTVSCLCPRKNSYPAPKGTGGIFALGRGRGSLQSTKNSLRLNSNETDVQLEKWAEGLQG